MDRAIDVSRHILSTSVGYTITQATSVDILVDGALHDLHDDRVVSCDSRRVRHFAKGVHLGQGAAAIDGAGDGGSRLVDHHRGAATHRGLVAAAEDVAAHLYLGRRRERKTARRKQHTEDGKP